MQLIDKYYNILFCAADKTYAQFSFHFDCCLIILIILCHFSLSTFSKKTLIYFTFVFK